jgi:phage baseplate assembly protein W
MSVNPSAFYDASATNNSGRSSRTYKDINLSFAKHPVTKDIATLTDVEAVKRSVRNLVNTNFYEKPFHPEIGSDVRRALFEPVSEPTANLLGRYVEDVIKNFEPRVELSNVICIGNIDSNAYEVVIEFYLQNVSSDLQTTSIFLERLR